MTGRQPSTSGPRVSIAPSSIKPRQLSQLHSQLAELSKNLANTENLLRMTSVQAESMRGLGGWHGGLFMAAAKVLGEDAPAGGKAQQQTTMTQQRKNFENEE